MDPGGYLVHPGDYLVASGGYFRRILEVIWTGVCSRDASKNSELNMKTTSGDFFGRSQLKSGDSRLAVATYLKISPPM